MTTNSESAAGSAEGRTFPQVVHKRGTFPSAGHNVVFSLSEGVPIHDRFEAQLSWDVTNSPDDIVIHLCVFLVDRDSKVPVGNPYYCVNHDNDRSKDGSTERSGRRQHGHSISDETIAVSLAVVNRDVYKIVFAAYIQDAIPLKHTFKDLVDGSVSFSAREGASSTEELILVEDHRLDSDYYAAETAVVMGELFRREDRWAYRSIGKGYLDLIEVGDLYGVTFIAG